MRTLRPGNERGHFNHGWLDTYHTFSFSDYQDPQHNNFRALRVINEDRVAGGQGFGLHPHRDMEIVTYVLSGALQHKDSLGNGEILKAGEVQRMTAGSGILHSEFNPSPTEAVHLYQIWIFPHTRGLKPGYEQRPVPTGPNGTWRLIASPDGESGSLTIQQDARILLVNLDPGQEATLPIATGRHVWLQVTRGEVKAGDVILKAGDGLAVSEESELVLRSDAAAEALAFDLA